MKLTTLTNIGPGLEKLLAEIGISKAEEFLNHDPEDLYRQLESKHPNLHLAVLASFIGAHTKTPWYFIYREVKAKYQGNR